MLRSQSYNFSTFELPENAPSRSSFGQASINAYFLNKERTMMLKSQKGMMQGRRDVEDKAKNRDNRVQLTVRRKGMSDGDAVANETFLDVTKRNCQETRGCKK